jgi:hypothetical protein
MLLPLAVSCSSDLPVKPVRKAVMEGVIRDPEGNGISGLNVSLLYKLRDYGSRPVAGTKTDSTGTYRVLVPEGTYDVALGSWFDAAPGFSYLELQSIRVVAPATRFDYRYSGFPVTGQVTGPVGATIDSGWVDVLDVSNPNYLTPSFYARTRVGPQGYKLFLPKRSLYNFYVTPAATNSGIPRRFFLRITVARDTTLNFPLDGHRVTGSVTLGGAIALDSTKVEAYSENGSSGAITGTDGTYLMYLPLGKYDWYVTPGRRDAYVFPLRQAGPEVYAPGTVDFDLSGTRWSGSVRLRTTGDPVGSVSVKAWQGDGYYSATSVTDPAGRFALIVRPGSRYNLFITPATPDMSSNTVLGVLAGSDSTFDLYVDPAGSVPGP